jgi:hypothetical protein
MSNMVLAVYDSSSLYCLRLSEYLRNSIRLAFDIRAFTEKEEFIKLLDREEIPLLIISEGCLKDLEDNKPKTKVKNMIVLEEDLGQEGGGRYVDEGVIHISKYVPAMSIAETVLELCVERAEDFAGLGIRHREGNCRVIGLYTPISGSGQTSLAVRMGEHLAADAKTILLSFDSFSALTGSLGNDDREDISDLCYFAECERDKFPIYLERIKINRAGLDYIPPADSPARIRELNCDRVKELIDLLSKKAGYENIILDLKDYPEGFFDILNLCDVIYTIGKNNSADQYRMGRYNKALCDSGYESVISKTVKCFFPEGRSPLGYKRYIKQLIEEGREVQSLGA